MKYALLALLTLLTFTSCHKHSCDPGAMAIHPDYFTFGVNEGFTGITHAFTIRDARIYKRDSMQAPLSIDKYTLAEPLLINFPDYLQQHPNSEIGIEPGSADERLFFIEYREGGQVFSWSVNSDASKQPDAIKQYINQMETIIYQL